MSAFWSGCLGVVIRARLKLGKTGGLFLHDEWVINHHGVRIVANINESGEDYF